MQFLIDPGIDMTIKDYRWNSNAQGCALRSEGREDGPVAGGGGTTAGTGSTISTPQSTCLSVTSFLLSSARFQHNVHAVPNKRKARRH